MACTVCVCVQYFVHCLRALVFAHTDLLACLFLCTCAHICTCFQKFVSVIISMEIFLGIRHTWYLCLDSTLCPFPQRLTFYLGYFSLSHPMSFVPIRLLKFYTFRSLTKNNRGDRNNWIKCHGYNLVPQKSDLCLLSL